MRGPLKVIMQNSITEGCQSIVINNGFLKRYESALFSVATTFKKEKPDIIVGLSRKAPRLIELMRISGIWLGEIPIISEKAIDFIPPEELEGKRILVFDDIVISGTTITNVLSNLAEKYNAQLKFVCLAIDKDTIALEKDEDDNYWVTLTNGEKIRLDHKVPLDKDERFIFCNEIVRSFAILNKPYDIDYPIFYISIDPDSLYILLAQLEPDKAYNLTTVHQYNKGFYRYTFLPAHQEKVDNFCKNVLHEFPLHAQVCKVRGYSNRKTGETALVSLVTFGADSRFLKKERILSDHFSCYDNLLTQAKSLLDSENETKAIYRFTWYLVNYLYGLSFIMRNLLGRIGSESIVPSKILRHEDLCYIFGPILAQIILNSLDLYYDQTVQKLKETYDKLVVSPHEQPEGSLKGKEIQSVFDEERDKLNKMIQPYIADHMKADQSLADQMAAIFEGLYYFVEIPAQETVRKLGIKGGECERLGVGFNLAQMKEILQVQGAIHKDSDEVDVKISLALDFLVDAGIAIPIFYYERDDGYFERAYRYGEDALSAKQYGYLIASTLKRLFDFMNKRYGKKVLPKITLEKQGVIFQEEIGRSGVVDVLKDLFDSGDREIIISSMYSRHGKILLISDEAYEETSPYPSILFTDWCEKENIIRSVKGGVSYTGQLFERYKFSDGYLPKLVSTDKLAIFESLAILLYHIDRILDKDGQSDFLIALTACGDHESYLWALREELRLFFKSDDYTFNLPLKMTIQYLDNGRYQTADVLEEALSLLSQKSYSASHAVRHKKKLWRNMHEILKAIDDYFLKDDAEIKILYEQNLKLYLDKIKMVHDSAIEYPLKDFRDYVEAFGEFCISLSTILKNLLELSTKIHKLRITKSGEIHATDIRVTHNNLASLRESIQAWNESVNNQPVTGFVGLTSIDVLRMNIDPFSSWFHYNTQDSDQLMRDIIPAIRKNYDILDGIYNGRCSLPAWRQKMNELFPRGENLILTGITRAIEAAGKCVSEDDKIHPKVGAVIIKEGEIVCEAYRGENKPGDHAEYTALIDKCEGNDLTGATMITTLEPCTSRRHGRDAKKPCALHIIDSGIRKVIIGMPDPNPEIRGKGILYLLNKKVEVELFPSKYQEQARELNRDFWEEQWRKYRIDLMKDLGSEAETYLKTIEAEMYTSNIQRSSEVLRVRIFEVLRERLDEEEVKTLCSVYSNVDYDDLGGQGKTARIRELVLRFYRENRISTFLDAIKSFKPEIFREIMEP